MAASPRTPSQRLPKEEQTVLRSLLKLRHHAAALRRLLGITEDILRHRHPSLVETIDHVIRMVLGRHINSERQLQRAQDPLVGRPLTTTHLTNAAPPAAPLHPAGSVRFPRLEDPRPGKIYEVQRGKKIRKVLSVKPMPDTQEIAVLLRYEDGSYELVPSAVLANHAPKVLIGFYESRLKFVW